MMLMVNNSYVRVSTLLSMLMANILFRGKNDYTCGQMATLFKIKLTNLLTTLNLF